MLFLWGWGNEADQHWRDLRPGQMIYKPTRRIWCDSDLYQNHNYPDMWVNLDNHICKYFPTCSSSLTIMSANIFPLVVPWQSCLQSSVVLLFYTINEANYIAGQHECGIKCTPKTYWLQDNMVQTNGQQLTKIIKWRIFKTDFTTKNCSCGGKKNYISATDKV